MKILQVVPEMRAGGVEVEALIVARGIRDHGHTSLLAAANNDMLSGEQGIGFYRLNLKSKNPLLILCNGFLLARLARRERVSLFHVRSRAPAWSVLLASRLSGIPFVATWHSTFGIDRYGLKKIYNGIMARGRYVISISGFITRYILDNYPVSPEKVIQIDRGVDLLQFTPTHKPVLARHDIGAPEGVVLMGSLGRISSGWKGFDVLVSALPLLPKNMHLVIAGSDQKNKKAELIELAKRLGVNDRLHFLAHLSSVLDFISLCDIGVSGVIKGEAFGRTAIEFQAMGKPFFGSDLGAFRENILYGSLFLPGNPQDCADKIQAFWAAEQKLSADELLARRQAACGFVREKYNQDVMVGKTIEVYQRALGQGQGG
jgi:glycosyltransferase involved in cell wall biosynthesis